MEGDGGHIDRRTRACSDGLCPANMGLWRVQVSRKMPPELVTPLLYSRRSSSGGSSQARKSSGGLDDRWDAAPAPTRGTPTIDAYGSEFELKLGSFGEMRITT